MSEQNKLNLPEMSYYIADKKKNPTKNYPFCNQLIFFLPFYFTLVHLTFVS